MKRSALLAAIALGASGCTYDDEGVFVVFLPDIENTVCDTAYEENFLDSDPPVTADVPSDWVYTSESTASDAALFIQVFTDKSGETLIDWNGILLVGTESKGVITASWTNQENTVDTATNTAGAYSWAESTDVTITTTVTLTPNKDIKGYSGNVAVDTDSTLQWQESDEWDADELGFNIGDINNYLYYLEGTASNGFNSTDCSGTPCNLKVVSSCNGSADFQAIETNLNAEDYSGVQDAGQPSGASQF